MKVDRLVSIIIILLEKRRVSALELANTFEVSPRTIYRDIDTINMAGIPIRSTPGVGGGFEIMPEYKVNNKVFSTNGLSTLLIGLSGLSNMMHEADLIHTLTKIKSFIPTDKAKEIELKANQIYIDFNPWICNKNTQPYFETIKTAIQNTKLLTFQYINHYGDKAIRFVEPYQLILKSNHWYFQGYCHTRNDYRLFRLSRMTELEIKDKNFIPRSYQKPILDITKMVEPIQIVIKLRIHKSIMDRVLDLCDYENFTPDGCDYYIVNFPFIDNDYYYDMLLSLGEKCECLEPLYVREKIKQKIHSICTIYNSL